MAETPKQPYSAPPPPEEKKEEPKAEAGPDAPPVDSGADEPTKEQLESAALYVEMYDSGVSILCEALVKDPVNYPASHFAMRKDLREQSTRHLAKGLAKGGGKWNMPWWVALCMVLALQGFLTMQAVKQAKAEKEARANRDRSARRPRPERTPPQEPITAAVVVDDHGQPVKEKEPAKPASAARPVTALKDFGPCQAEGCANRITRKGKRTCGQSCAAKLTNAKRKAAKLAAVA